jgi:xanthosine utilization system XapX-like protein
LVELHVNVEAPPEVTLVGFAVRMAVGTTETVAVATPLVPPAPLQVSE